jgi:hypothetical protein
MPIQAKPHGVYPMLVTAPHASFCPKGGGGFFWKKNRSRFLPAKIYFSVAQCDDSELNFSFITEL